MHRLRWNSRLGVVYSVNMRLLSLMLLERNKQGTRFIPNEWLRTLIYQRHSMTMHSSFITFWAAVRSCAHPGLKCIDIRTSSLNFCLELRHSLKENQQLHEIALNNTVLPEVQAALKFRNWLSWMNFKKGTSGTAGGAILPRHPSRWYSEDHPRPLQKRWPHKDWLGVHYN